MIKKIIDNVKKDNELKSDFIIFLLFIMLIICLLTFIKPKKAMASDISATDVLLDLGFSGVIDRSSYEYSYIMRVSGGYLVHFYDDVPLRVRYVYDTNHHMLIAVNGKYDAYSPVTMSFYESGNVNGSNWNFHRLVALHTNNYTKESIVDHNYNPDGDLSVSSKLYYVSGNIGVVVHDNSMADLGYDKGDVFFFTGNYSNGSSESPITPPGDTNNPGLGDDDKSWFSGLFSGVTQTINNVKDTIISGVTSAFEVVGQTIINGIKAIFIPDVDFLTEKIDSVKEKFAFIDNISEAFDNVSSLLTDGNETVPQMTIDLSKAESNYNYGSSAVALDMTWYSRYKPYVDGVIIAFSYISFIFLIFKRAPEIIKGSGAITKGLE